MGLGCGGAIRIGKHHEEPLAPRKGYLTPFLVSVGNPLQIEFYQLSEMAACGMILFSLCP